MCSVGLRDLGGPKAKLASGRAVIRSMPAGRPSRVTSRRHTVIVSHTHSYSYSAGITTSPDFNDAENTQRKRNRKSTIFRYLTGDGTPWAWHSTFGFADSVRGIGSGEGARSC